MSSVNKSPQTTTSFHRFTLLWSFSSTSYRPLFYAGTQSSWNYSPIHLLLHRHYPSSFCHWPTYLKQPSHHHRHVHHIPLQTIPQGIHYVSRGISIISLGVVHTSSSPVLFQHILWTLGGNNQFTSGKRRGQDPLGWWLLSAILLPPPDGQWGTWTSRCHHQSAKLAVLSEDLLWWLGSVYQWSCRWFGGRFSFLPCSYATNIGVIISIVVSWSVAKILASYRCRHQASFSS